MKISTQRGQAFTVVELLVAISIVALLAAMGMAAWRQVYKSSSLAVSANNLRQLSAGAMGYLAENNHVFWRYRFSDPQRPGGVTWWYGFETSTSMMAGEGNRIFDPEGGPLAGYIPAGLRPDPSFGMGGKAFKPKYRFGYIGTGYNVLLGGGWLGTSNCWKYWDLPAPGRIVVFATSAQVNAFQKPASSRNPMLEEFYGLDEKEVTVHFRHKGNAMVVFANGSAGFLPMDPATVDSRAPEADVARFSPKGSTTFLLPDTSTP